MAISLKTPAERLAGREREIIQRGIDLTIGCVNAKPPTIKSALVTAALELYENDLRAETERAAP